MLGGINTCKFIFQGSGLPWGREPQASGLSLGISDDDHFPTLGDSGRGRGVSALSSGWGRSAGPPSAVPAGRGGGFPVPAQSYDNEFPGPTSSSWGNGTSVVSSTLHST